MKDEDDKQPGIVLPTRTGAAQGKALENRMLSDAPAISTKIRTFDNGSGQTSVLMRTRAGMPEFITTVDQFVPQVDPCVKGHFIEGPIENRVVFEPNEGDDSNVRVFSTDYLFSRITKLAKKIKGVVAGKQFKFILAQDGVGTAAGVPSKNAPVESGSRTYHPAVIAYEEAADAAGNGEPRGLHFEIHRFKALKFKFSVQGKVVTYTFANAAGTLPVPDAIGCMNKDADELGFDVPYRDRDAVDTLQAVKLKSKKTGKILLEFSGGVPEAFPPPEAGKEADRLKVVDDNDVEALDLSKVANYGQAWHGKLTNVGVHTVVDGIPSVVTPKGYVPPTSGDVTYIRSPLAVAREVTNPPVTDPLLLTAGAKFNDYALLFGAAKRYSTTSGWNVGANRFVHFDASGFARVVEVEVTCTSNTLVTMRFVYKKPLWDVAPENDFPLDSQLGLINVTVSLYRPTYMNAGLAFTGSRFNQSPSGDRLAVMIIGRLSALEQISGIDQTVQVVEVSINQALTSFSAAVVWTIPDPAGGTTGTTGTTLSDPSYVYRELTGVSIIPSDYGDMHLQNAYDWWEKFSTYTTAGGSLTRTYLLTAYYATSGGLVLSTVPCELFTDPRTETKRLTGRNSITWVIRCDGNPALVEPEPPVGGPRGAFSLDTGTPTVAGGGYTHRRVVHGGVTAFYDTFWPRFPHWENPEAPDVYIIPTIIPVTNMVSRIVTGSNDTYRRKMISAGGKVASEVKTYGSYNPATDELAVSDTPIAFS